ncbi:MAG: AAA family ATPase [Deltaproteobacteria bacterium]|jgi:CO dehydrogenase maturation factor|nr:AAA family ATPase [Deltaproteobacteria bacterium]
MLRQRAYTFALAGKGGTGKTTLAGLLVRFLKEHDMTPILAVDADSNANFNEVLGLTVEGTLGQAREAMKTSVPVGMTKDIFIEMKVEQALVEAEDFDLIVMGRPEGPGCYCAANNLLSKCIDRLLSNYPYLVIDNEAGMEHFSRLTSKDIDVLLVVSDPSRRGMLSARRICDLVDELGIRVGRKFLVINQYRQGLTRLVSQQIEGLGPASVATIPEDELIYQFDLEGKPTIQLPSKSVALQAANEIFARLLDEVVDDQDRITSQPAGA